MRGGTNVQQIYRALVGDLENVPFVPNVCMYIVTKESIAWVLMDGMWQNRDTLTEVVVHAESKCRFDQA